VATHIAYIDNDYPDYDRFEPERRAMRGREPRNAVEDLAHHGRNRRTFHPRDVRSSPMAYPDRDRIMVSYTSLSLSLHTQRCQKNSRSYPAPSTAARHVLSRLACRLFLSFLVSWFLSSTTCSARTSPSPILRHRHPLLKKKKRRRRRRRYVSSPDIHPRTSAASRHATRRALAPRACERSPRWPRWNQPHHRHLVE
jgi:hypothetical protein